MKVYGPYTRKDGRQVVIKIWDEGRTTQSYPRYLMELHLGRELLPEEEVDHIDNDFSNNVIENFQLLSKKENRIKEMERPHRKRKLFKGICSICGAMFEKYLNEVAHNRRKGKAGPFCSRKCAGIYSTNKQYGSVAQTVRADDS